MRSFFLTTSARSYSKDTYAALDLVARKLTIISPEGITDYEIDDGLASGDFSKTGQILHDKKLTKLAVRLPGVIQVTAKFPATARRNLRDVISYEIDRLTPLQAEHAHFTYRVKHKGSDDTSVSVDITAIAIDQLNIAKNIADTLNCRLEYLGADPVHQRDANLMQSQPRSDTNSSTSRPYLVAAFLLMTLILTPFIQKKMQISTLEKVVKPIEFSARQKVATLHSLEDSLMWIDTIERDSPRFLDILQDIARQLGEQDVISYLIWNKSELEIAGTSTNSNQLIKKFATTSNVNSIEYLNPFQSKPEQGLEGFHIRLQFADDRSLVQSDG